MALQVFIQNPESGEPWALCGSVKDHWEDLAKAIGHFTQAEVEGLAVDGEQEFSLDIKLVEMSEEEVAALPDI